MSEADTQWTLYPQAHILIMDDDPVSGLYYQKLIEKQGYQQVGLVHTLDELTKYLAWTLNNHLDLDLFLLDINMPKLSGIEVCKRLKSHKVFKDVPILMLTGSEDMGDIVQSFREGAQDFIRKPVQVLELNARINAALRTHHEIKTLKNKAESSQTAAQQLQAFQAQMQDFASIDTLTGLGNFQAFEKELKTIWQSVAENYEKMALIFFEIDRFQEYNEIYGQYKGDQCLKQLTQMLLGLGHPCFKLSGTRFGVILAQTTPEATSQVAHQISKTVKSFQIPNSESRVGKILTISTGAALVNPDEYGDQVVELVNCAEQALLRAKSAGGNSVNILGLAVSGLVIHT